MFVCWPFFGDGRRLINLYGSNLGSAERRKEGRKEKWMYLTQKWVINVSILFLSLRSTTFAQAVHILTSDMP